MLPIVFIVHDLEEILCRKRWMKNNAAELVRRFPKMKPILMHLKDISTTRFCIIVGEELLLIVVAMVMFIYANQNFLLALFWGFSLHLFVHIGQAIVAMRYVPGVVSSVLFLPYVAFGIFDLCMQFSWRTNLLLSVCGLTVVGLNLLLMHKLLHQSN